MTFDELPTLVAVYQAEKQIEERRAAGEDIPQFGSDDWLIEERRRDELLSIIQHFRTADPDLLRVYLRYRKSGDGKSRIMAKVAELRGIRCFYADRGKGPCSPDVDLDRIKPESRGGTYTVENCQIACSRHNRERGDKTIEEYLFG